MEAGEEEEVRAETGPLLEGLGVRVLGYLRTPANRKKEDWCESECDPKKTRNQKGLGKDLMTIITHYFLSNTYSWSSFRSVKLITQCFRSNISSVWVLRNYNLNEDQVREVNRCKQTGNSIQLHLGRSSFLKSLNRNAIENVN